MSSRRGDSLHLLGSNLARYAGQFALLALCVQLGDRELAGRFVLATAICAPLFVLSNLGLRMLLITFDRPYRFASFNRVRTTTSAVSVLVITTGTWAYEPRLAPMVAGVAAMKYADAVVELCLGHLQRLGNTRGVLLLSLTVTCAGLLAALGGAALSPDALVPCAAAAQVLCATVAQVGTARRARALEEATEQVWSVGYRPLLVAGLASGLTWGLSSLIVVMPQYVLGGHYGAAVVALYAGVLYLVTAGDVLVNSITQAWLTRAVENHRTGTLDRRSTTRTTLRTTAQVLPLLVVTTLVGAVALHHLLGSAYTLSRSTAGPVAVCLLVLPLVYYSGAALAALNLYRRRLVINVVALAVCTGCSLWWVPAHGIPGAFWTYAASLVVRGVLNLVAIPAAHPARDATHQPS